MKIKPIPLPHQSICRLHGVTITNVQRRRVAEIAGTNAHGFMRAMNRAIDRHDQIDSYLDGYLERSDVA